MTNTKREAVVLDERGRVDRDQQKRIRWFPGGLPGQVDLERLHHDLEATGERS